MSNELDGTMANSVVHEVERRYWIEPGRIVLIKNGLARAGFAPAYTVRQVDEYFTSKHKDFIISEECLRIRNMDSRIILTWKPPSTDEMRLAPEFWKQEIEFNVDATANTVRQFLIALDFVPYITVDKTRSAYRDSSGAEVSIDKVLGLGDFVEVELQSADVESARRHIVQLSADLGLRDEDLSTVPYRDLVSAKAR